MRPQLALPDVLVPGRHAVIVKLQHLDLAYLIRHIWTFRGNLTWLLHVNMYQLTALFASVTQYHSQIRLDLKRRSALKARDKWVYCCSVHLLKACRIVHLHKTCMHPPHPPTHEQLVNPLRQRESIKTFFSLKLKIELYCDWHDSVLIRGSPW